MRCFYIFYFRKIQERVIQNQFVNCFNLEKEQHETDIYTKVTHRDLCQLMKSANIKSFNLKQKQLITIFKFHLKVVINIITFTAAFITLCNVEL